MTRMELYFSSLLGENCHPFFEPGGAILDIFPLSPNSFVLRIPLVTFLRSIVADLLAFFLLLFVASLVIYQYLPPLWLTTTASKLGTPITELLWHNFLLCFQIDLSSTDMKSSSRSFLYFFLSSFFLYLPMIALCSGLFFFLGSTFPPYHC